MTFSATLSDGSVYSLSGFQFKYNGDGFPVSGAIDQLDITMPGQGTASVFISMSVPEFLTFVKQNPGARFDKALFAGNDVINGGPGNDHLFGFDGNDAISGLSGNDIIDGGKGNDELYGGTGNSVLIGGNGNDHLAGNDTGNDKMDGGVGDDMIDVGAGKDMGIGGVGDDEFFLTDFTEEDRVDGGKGFDTAILYGDHSSGLTLTSKAMVGVEKIAVQGSWLLKLTTSDATVMAGATLAIDAGGNTKGVTFDGSAERDGRFDVFATQYNDVLTGGAGNDRLDAGTMGRDVVYGGAGNDTVQFQGGYDTDKIDGGDGKDVLILSGNYPSLVFTKNHVSNIETIHLETGKFFGKPFQYSVRFENGVVGAGKALTIDATQSPASATIDIDASAERHGKLVFLGGLASETFIGGQFSNSFNGGAGADRITAGEGNDVFVYRVATDSTGPRFDKITHLDGASDHFHFDFKVSGLDADVDGVLTKAHFDDNLSAAVAADDLAAHHAVLLHSHGGSFPNETFLIVDANGKAGYQAGEDFVINLSQSTNLDQLVHVF